MPNSSPLIDDIQNCALNIVDTVREPLLILDATLRVQSANRAFYQTFHVSPAETEGRLIYELGNGQWDIPDLRTLLEDIVPKSSVFDDFELEHTFPDIGRRVMLLNARKLQAGQHGELLVLAMEDVTARRQVQRLKSGEGRVTSDEKKSGEGRVTSDENVECRTHLATHHSPLATPPDLTTHHSPLATPLKVLVVDDNVDTVLSFSMLLRASGHEVQTAHDGLKAVQAAIDYRPDIVLLDIGLPGLNGYEVARQIRQHPDLKHVVLVALTGYGQDSDRQASDQAGFTHHLVKPARFEEVQKILATVAEQVA